MLNQTVSVVLVTDAPLLRAAILHAVAPQTTVAVVGTAASCAEAAAAVAALRPVVVLLDLHTARCIEIVRTLRDVAPAVSIVAFLVDFNDQEQLVCVEAGVTGFVHRRAEVSELEAAIAAGARGEAVCSASLVGAAFRRVAQLAASETSLNSNGTALTVREIEILRLIGLGLSNKEISQRLQVSIPTVKNHVHSILDKWHVRGRWEAAARFAQLTQNGQGEK